MCVEAGFFQIRSHMRLTKSDKIMLLPWIQCVATTAQCQCAILNLFSAYMMNFRQHKWLTSSPDSYYYWSTYTSTTHPVYMSVGIQWSPLTLHYQLIHSISPIGAHHTHSTITHSNTPPTCGTLHCILVCTVWVCQSEKLVWAFYDVFSILLLYWSTNHHLKHFISSSCEYWHLPIHSNKNL